MDPDLTLRSNDLIETAHGILLPSKKLIRIRGQLLKLSAKLVEWSQSSNGRIPISAS